MEKKKILLAMTNLGAAHKQSAVSIGNAIRENHPDTCDVRVIDVFTEGKTIIDPLFKKGYRYFSNHLTFLYAVFFYVTNVPFIAKALQNMFDFHVVKKMSEIVKEYRPDIIVSTYPVFPAVFHKACRRVNHRSKIVALVMDYETGHSTWLTFKEVEAFLISSDECYRKAISFGIPAGRIIRVGVPLSQKFSEKMPPEAINKLRKELGCRDGQIMALIAGGGEGLGHACSILKYIINSGAKIHPVVVCGRNKELKKQLDRLVHDSNSGAKVFGFVNFMYELMNAADIIISKGGYLTINEALFLGKPLFIASYVPGQEKGNIRFVEKNRVGYYIPDIKKLVKKINSLSDNKADLLALKKNVTALGLKNGTKEIADLIVGMLK